MYDLNTDIFTLRAAAKAHGLRWVGVSKQQLVTQLNELTQVKPKRSKHKQHELCQELLGLLQQVDVNKATVVRHQKVVPLLTEKERQLLQTFLEEDCQVQRTAERLGFSHTNVWQRLYGTPNKPEKPAKGILGKLREYCEQHALQLA